MPGALLYREVISMDVVASLWTLRKWRVSQHRHTDLANEFMYMAGKGMGAQKALDLGGTGNCPLTNYSDAYDLEHRLSVDAKVKANTLWAAIVPLLDSIDIDFDTRQVVELFFNSGTDREDIPGLIKRSVPACNRMYHEALAKMSAVK